MTATTLASDASVDAADSAFVGSEESSAVRTSTSQPFTADRAFACFTARRTELRIPRPKSVSPASTGARTPMVTFGFVAAVETVLVPTTVTATSATNPSAHTARRYTWCITHHPFRTRRGAPNATR